LLKQGPIFIFIPTTPQARLAYSTPALPKMASPSHGSIPQASLAKAAKDYYSFVEHAAMRLGNRQMIPDGRVTSRIPALTAKPPPADLPQFEIDKRLKYLENFKQMMTPPSGESEPEYIIKQESIMAQMGRNETEGSNNSEQTDSIIESSVTSEDENTTDDDTDPVKKKSPGAQIRSWQKSKGLRLQRRKRLESTSQRSESGTEVKRITLQR
jgi:hypothetical protein